MNNSEWLLAAALAFGLSFIATPLWKRIAQHLGILDVPNERSSHEQPTPRGGGTAIISSVVIVALWLLHGVMSREVLALLTLTVVVALVGLIDDARGLRAAPKLLVQIVCGIVVIWTGTALSAVSITTPIALGATVRVALSLVWILGLTNAFNFMDGINGIASLQAIVSGAALMVLFSRAGDVEGTVVGAALAAAALGFLPWNFPSASVFMGDVGSSALGFCFASLSIRLANHNGSVLAAFLIFMPFLADTGVTLLRRAIAGESVLTAHRSHYYQKLTALGWGHAAVSSLWLILAMMSAGVALNLQRMRSSGQYLALVVLIGLHAACFGWIDIAARRRRETH